MKNKKVYSSIAAFLLLFPFRLPISVGLIILFNKIAGLAGKMPSNEILCGNVVITKLVYDLALTIWMVYSIEFGTRKILKRRAKEKVYGEDLSMFWWTYMVLFFSLSYIIYDCIATYQLFWGVIGLPVPN